MIVDFEKMRRHVSDEAVKAIRPALKRIGVEFIHENGGGPGVRLREGRAVRHRETSHIHRSKKTRSS